MAPESSEKDQRGSTRDQHGQVRILLFSGEIQGFLVNESGLQTDPDKIEPILNYPVPRNLKEVRKILGMAGWYRRFIANYATVVSPLTCL